MCFASFWARAWDWCWPAWHSESWERWRFPASCGACFTELAAMTFQRSYASLRCSQLSPSALVIYPHGELCASTLWSLCETSKEIYGLHTSRSALWTSHAGEESRLCGDCCDDTCAGHRR